MIEDAERSGRIKPGDTLIEPTSGNTGIGMALAAAVKGYRCIIVLPEKMSKEKVDVLKALGAEIIRTPTEAAWDAPDSHISIARKMQQETDNSHILDQYTNPANPLAHYDGTAEEILRQLDGRVDMLVCGAGTGGTISGIAARVKEANPDCVVVGVDPVGSILAQPDSLNDPGRNETYHVEGIGYDFVPGVLDRSLVDRWMKSNDSESLVMMRRLIRDEGMLCGGSSGSAVAAAVQAASGLGEGQNCVVVLPDSVRNYMTKALSDDWMVEKGFVDERIIMRKQYKDWCVFLVGLCASFLFASFSLNDYIGAPSDSRPARIRWADKRVCDLQLNTPLTISSSVRCKDAISVLLREGFDMVPIVDDEGGVIGVVTEGNLSKMLMSKRAQPNQPLSDAGVIYKTFKKLAMNATLAELASALDIEPYALVVTEQRCFAGRKKKRSADEDSKETGASSSEAAGGQMKVTKKCVVSGIVTRIDLLAYIANIEDDDDDD